MRKKGHKLRDSKRQWFSKYSSWTRGQDQCHQESQQTWEFLGPTQSYWIRNGLGLAICTLTSLPGDLDTWSHLRITSIRKSSDRTGMKRKWRQLVIPWTASPGRNGPAVCAGGNVSPYSVHKQWLLRKLRSSWKGNEEVLGWNLDGNLWSKPPNQLWHTAPWNPGPSSQQWDRPCDIYKRKWYQGRIGSLKSDIWCPELLLLGLYKHKTVKEKEQHLAVNLDWDILLTFHLFKIHRLVSF